MIEVVGPAADRLGESPVWDDRTERLFWIDIDGKAIRKLDPVTGREESRSLPGRPGSIGMTGYPNVTLVSMEHEVGWLEWDSGTYEPWLDLEEPGTGNRLNDGRCDPAGRYWVGSMFERVSARRFTGILHRLDPSGTVTEFRKRVGVANGLAFSPDGTTMYFADTLRKTVWAYDYEPATGARSNERVFTNFSGLPGAPDGACVDEDGCYWVACVYGWAVARLTPGGQIDRIIDLPVEKPTMPAFGGAALDTLFVTSMGDGEPRSRSPNRPQTDAGRLLALDVGVRGMKEPRFAGSRMERSKGDG